MSNLSKLANLTTAQRELLLKRLNKANRQATTSEARITPRARQSNRFPLSFSQQRLWFFDQVVPGNPFFNIPAAVRFRGPLDIEALELSLNEIIRRHEVLRATFAVEDGTPVQVISPDHALRLERIDLRSLPEDEREREARQLATEDARRPFDLSTGPLLRATILKLDEQEHALLFTMHHIASDAWSMGILMRELAALYDAFSKGEASPLDELQLQYTDYAVWQRERLQGPVLEEQLSYWKKQLEGITPLELPTDKPRPAVQTFRGAREFLGLSKDLSDQIRELARLQGVSLFVVLLAAFKVLLHRYSGQDDIVLGSLIAGRNRAEVEGLIGFFVNALVMRTDLSGNPTFRELVERARQVALGAYSHQDLPLEKIVDELQPERNLSRHPLFQVHFVLQNAPREAAEMPGLNVSPQGFDSEVIRVDLEFHLWDGADSIAGNLVYNTDLYQAATIRRMLGHFETLLLSIAADPDGRISELPVLTASELRQLVYDLNDTGTYYGEDSCLHHAFETHAANEPEALALVFGQETLTYGQLNASANKLARRLRSLGAGPESRVGICVERSPLMVAGILGILKAGAAYVPMDPSYPQQRLRLMLEDARVSVLLTQSALADRLPPHAAEVIYIDEGGPALAKESIDNLATISTPNNLAYVIYTSGSTGKPKGVALAHRGVVNNLRDLNRNFNIGRSDRTLAISSISFDMCVYETLGTLEAGGTIVMPEPEFMRDPERWAELIIKHGVTVWNSAPALLKLLVDCVEDKPELWPRSLRVALLGGDWIPLLLPDRLKALATGVKVVALGGATEASIHSTVYTVEQSDPAWKSIPYGRPMRNQQAYVLDGHLQITPAGIAGELHLGGMGLARGYFDAPELTAQKFIPSPFATEPGARIYKTGDLARYTADGTIELLGRIDHQVKLRGYRIELGEIVSAIRRLPGVCEAVVMIREDEPGNQKLVAYIVADDGTVLAPEDLRRSLKASLPDYMVPSAFVLLDALPLSPNGKVDRRSLPAPGLTPSAQDRAFVPPRTETEKLLAQIWAEALGQQEVGVHDNFFDIGGDSILAIQVIHRANRQGLRLSPGHMFGQQTIAELAALDGIAQQIIAEQAAVTGRAPLTPSQLWFFENNFEEQHHWNQAIMLEALEPVEPRLIATAVERILVHHDALRLRFKRDQHGWHQWHAAPEEPPFSMMDLSALSPAEQTDSLRSRALELQASLDLSEGPLVRAAYFDLGKDRAGRLLLIVHHLAVDSVSWALLLEDLLTAYNQLKQGADVHLSPKTTSYKLWAEKLVEKARSPETREELYYWADERRGRASGAPLDFPEGVNDEASTASVGVSLGVEETAALLRHAPKAYGTQINDVLLAALSLAFSRRAGAESLLVSLGGHGREDLFEGVDLTRTVGWFTFSYPVLLEVERAASIPQTVESIRKQVGEVPGRGIGYGLLRYLSADPEVSGRLKSQPQPQVGFNYIGQVNQVLPGSVQFAPAQDERVPVHSPRARRPHPIDLFAEVRNNQFHCTWVYSRNLHRAGTIEALALEFIQALREIINCAENLLDGSAPQEFATA